MRGQMFTSEVAVTGTYEAVAEVCMTISSQLAVSTYRGGFRAPYSKDDWRAPVVVLHDFQEMTPGLKDAFVDTPIRHLGNESVGWHAPNDAHDTHDCQVLGVRPLWGDDAPTYPVELSRAVCSFQSADALPLDLVIAISKRCPDVVVTAVFTDGNGDYLSAAAYRAGAVLKEVGDEDLASVDLVTSNIGSDENYDDVRTCTKRRRESAHEVLWSLAIAELGARPRKSVTPAFGFPRWSLLAHAAYDGGIKGLLRAMSATQTPPSELTADMVGVVCAARAAGVASWADTLLFGHLKDLPDLDGVPREPHAEMAPAVYLARHRELLSVLGSLAHADLPESPLATALVASLSDPAVRLLSGMQPVAHLAACCGKRSESINWASIDAESAARKGLTALIAGLALKCPSCKDAPVVDQVLHTSASEAVVLSRVDYDRDGILSGPRLNPDFTYDPEQDKLLGSVITIALEAPLQAESLGPALAVGVPAGVLFRSALWCGIYRSGVSAHNESHASNYFTRLLASFSKVYGSRVKFPSDLKDEMETLGPALKPLYDAVHNESLMRASIEAATGNVQHGLNEAARPRRRMVGA